MVHGVVYISADESHSILLAARLEQSTCIVTTKLTSIVHSKAQVGDFCIKTTNI